MGTRGGRAISQYRRQCRDRTEDDGNLARRARQRTKLRHGIGKDYVWLETYELGRIGARALNVAAAPTQIDLKVAALGPSELP
jgi:hypothetical protein